MEDFIKKVKNAIINPPSDMAEIATLMAEAQNLLTPEQMAKVTMEMTSFQAKAATMSDNEKLAYVERFANELLSEKKDTVH